MDVFFDSCFSIDTESNETSAEGAKYICENITNYAGQLAWVRNTQEMDYLYWRLEDLQIDKSEMFYTGIEYKFNSDSSQYQLSYGYNGEYIDTNPDLWPDGGPWAWGYPSSSQHQCVGLIYDKTQYRWRFADVDCDQNVPFICGITLGNIMLQFLLFLFY